MFPCFSVAFFLFPTVTQAFCVLRGGGSIRQCPREEFWAAWRGVRDLCRQWLDVGRSTIERALVPVEGSCKGPENDCYWLVPCDAYEGLYIAIAIDAEGGGGRCAIKRCNGGRNDIQLKWPALHEALGFRNTSQRRPVQDCYLRCQPANNDKAEGWSFGTTATLHACVGTAVLLLYGCVCNGCGTCQSQTVVSSVDTALM
ncbi:hypothetical protein V8C26DRAFT_416163 [Trichoderma gracile]